MSIKEEFKSWLRTKVDTIAPLSSYPNALENFIPNELNQRGETLYSDIFECNDIEYLKELYTRLSGGGDLHDFNVNTQSRLPSASVKKYIEFLKYKKVMQEVEKYNNSSSIFDTNDAYIYFTINNDEDSKYPTKAICKNIYRELDLSEDFRTNGAKLKLQQIFGINNINFVDIRESKIIEEKQNKTFIKIKNIILYGAPGVGKTHNYQRIISMIENGGSESNIFNTITNNKDEESLQLNSDFFQNIKNDKRVEFVTFHQSYSYEDFIEGYRPKENGNIKLESGIFKNIVTKALERNNKNFYIVIDEINRGNISKIFGELITLIEESKRDNYEVTLPYSKEKFKVPSNLYIIATMNSTDKSIATIGIALRRRFTFLKMKPNSNLVKNQEAKELMEKLNIYIEKELGEDYMLGHSYFMGDDVDLEFIQEYKIKPLLEEYFYSDDKTADQIIKEAIGESDGK